MRTILFILIVSFIYGCKEDHESLVTKDELNAWFDQHKEFKDYRDQVVEYYAGRNGRFIWFDNDMNGYGKEFLKRVSRDSTDAGDIAKRLAEIANNFPAKRKPSSDSLAAYADIGFTVAFFEFADRNWVGFTGKEIRRSGWLIKPRSVSIHALLDSLLSMKPDDLADYDPVYVQHRLLKEKLKEYSLLKENGWKDLTVVKPLKPGDNDPMIVSIRNNLALMNDLSDNNKSAKYDESFSQGVSSFQERNGLEVNGIIDTETAKALEKSPAEIADILQVNLERCRWFPEHLPGDNIVVNVPAYELSVINNDSVMWKCNVVVGSDSTNTLIFNDVMEYVVFSPHWNIPKSIIYKETIPAVMADRSYLEKHNMEIVDKEGNPVDAGSVKWHKVNEDFEYTIRQKPGTGNALGKVKFLLPNAHNIYLHDTPAKSLFGETERAFSHGCVRVSEPFKLAQYVLRNDPQWTDEAIRNAMDSGEEKFVKLKQKVPVYLTYFTAWVDDKGKLQLRKDLYGLDRKTEKLL